MPWLILALVLVIIDLRFGIMAAKKRHEKIRTSRMWRRSLNKIFDYLCWVTFAGLCGHSIGVVMDVPVVSVGTLLIVYGIEISSCMNNYLEYKGIKKKFNFFKLIQRKDIEDTLEDVPETTEKTK